MFTPARHPPHLVTLIVLTAVPILTLNMFLPALAALAAEFGVTYGQAALSVSAYMIVTALLQLVVGPLSDRYGRRPVLLVSVAVFTVASIGCALADSFATFMAWRVLQASVISANALARAIVRDVSAPQEAAARLGTIGSVMALGPMLAPLIGGLVLAGFGWRANFEVFAVLGLFLLWLIWADAGETAPKVPRSIRAQGVAYGQLLRDRGFWSYAGCCALSVGVFFAYISGVPLVVETQFGLSPAVAGAAMGAPPLGFMAGNIVSARIARRVPLAKMMLMGRVATLGGVGLAAALWALGGMSVPPLALVLLMTFIGIGNGLTLPSGSAAGLSGALMLLTGAAASSVTGWALGAFGGGAGLLLAILLAISAAALAACLPAQRLPAPDAVGV